MATARAVTTHRLVGIAVFALAAFLAIGLLWIENQTGYAGISNRTVPGLVSVGLAVCGLMLLFRRWSGEPSLEQAQDQRPQFRQLVWLIAGLSLTIASIGSIGFPLAGVLLMLCVARGYGSVRPLRDALVALALTTSLWLLFTKLLTINLPLLPLLGI